MNIKALETFFEPPRSHVKEIEMKEKRKKTAKKKKNDNNDILNIFKPPEVPRKTTKQILFEVEKSWKQKAFKRIPKEKEFVETIDLRSNYDKHVALLKMQYYELFDLIAEYSNILAILNWTLLNLQQKSTTMLLPYFEPEIITKQKEQERIRKLRQGFTPKPNLITYIEACTDPLVRMMLSDSIGTHYTRYYHPKAQDLMNIHFGATRKKKLNKKADYLLASGWWREEPFDLRPKESDDAQQVGSQMIENPIEHLEKQIKNAQKLFIRLKSLVSKQRIIILQMIQLSSDTHDNKLIVQETMKKLME